MMAIKRNKKSQRSSKKKTSKSQSKQKQMRGAASKKTARAGGARRASSAKRTIGQGQNRRRQLGGEEIFGSTIQKTNIWLKDVARAMGAPQDPHKGYLALRAVLQTLRDRLPLHEAVHLGSQLPMLVRGFYYEGWSPSDKPVKYDREEFLQNVMGYFRTNEGGITPAGVTRAVFQVLREYISEGELTQVIGAMPKQLQSVLTSTDREMTEDEEENFTTEEEEKEAFAMRD